MVYLLTIAPRLLAQRSEIIQELGDRRREYLLEMLVQPTCPLIGKSVEQAGLRNLPGLFLIEISRPDEIITPVTPADVIREGDRMVFTGVVQTIADLERIPGLVPAADMTYEFHPAQRTQRRLTEAVLSRTSPLIGRSVREANFRQRYNAAIVAVHRNGERLTNKIGSIRLEPGDTLLLQTHAEFVEAYRNSRDFYLVSTVGETSARRHDRALVAVGLFLLMIVWLTLAAVFGNGEALGGWGNLFANKPHAIIALTVVVLMIATRSMTTEEARSAIDLQVIVTIAAAIGLGQALKTSGAAEFIARSMVEGTAASGIAPELQPYVLLGTDLPGDRGVYRDDLERGGGRHDDSHRGRRGPGRTRRWLRHQALYPRGGAGRLAQLRHPHRLPDQLDGHGARRLPPGRLPPRRRAHDLVVGGAERVVDPTGVAVLGAILAFRLRLHGSLLVESLASCQTWSLGCHDVHRVHNPWNNAQQRQHDVDCQAPIGAKLHVHGKRGNEERN